MRVILTIDYSPWSNYSGGAQLSTHNIAIQMVKRGHKVHVINTKPPWEKITIPENLPYFHHWAALPAYRSKQSNTFRHLSGKFVNKEIENILSNSSGKSTIIHSNGEEGGLINQLKRKYNFGFISTPRHPHYPKLFYIYPFENIPFHVKTWLWLRHSKFIMQAKAARNADLVCPPSQWSSNILQKAFDIPEYKIHPVHNGVPPEFLRYSRAENSQDGPIVFFGRFSKTKGVDTLIEALAQLNKRKLPDVHLIGRGHMEQKLRERVRLLGLGSKIIFKSWMSHNQLAHELSRASMAVFPSREENFSLAILGSMAIGVPTISTNVGGTPEIITHGKNGLLVASEDHINLASNIHYVLDNKEKSIELGNSAYHHVRKHITWEGTAMEFERLYKHVSKNQEQS